MEYVVSKYNNMSIHIEYCSRTYEYEYEYEYSKCRKVHIVKKRARAGRRLGGGGGGACADLDFTALPTLRLHFLNK